MDWSQVELFFQSQYHNLVAYTASRLYRIGIHRGQGCNPEEIVHETFLKIAQNKPDMLMELRYWWTALENRCLDLGRSKKRRQGKENSTTTEDDGERSLPDHRRPTPEAEVELDQLVERLYRCLPHCMEKQGSDELLAVLMDPSSEHFILNHPPRDLAANLGTTALQISRYKDRPLKSILRCLAECMERRSDLGTASPHPQHG